MPLLTLDETRQRLAPHTEDVLVASFQTAVKEWNELLRDKPRLAASFSLTTRANIIHDVTCSAVRAALPGRENIRELKSLGFFALAVNNDLIVRFKYVVTGIPRNVSTDQQELLAKHRYDEEMMLALQMEGIPKPPTIVTCGYKLRDDGSIRRISVQCDYDKSPLWKYYIFGEPGEGGGSFEVLPLDPTLAPDTGVVVRSKTHQSADEQQTSGDQS